MRDFDSGSLQYIVQGTPKEWFPVIHKDKVRKPQRKVEVKSNFFCVNSKPWSGVGEKPEGTLPDALGLEGCGFRIKGTAREVETNHFAIPHRAKSGEWAGEWVFAYTDKRTGEKYLRPIGDAVRVMSRMYTEKKGRYGNKV